MNEQFYKHGINVHITTVNKRGLFTGKTGYVEITTPVREINTESNVLIGMLTQFFTPQLTHPIFLLRITDTKLLTP